MADIMMAGKFDKLLLAAQLAGAEPHLWIQSLGHRSSNGDRLYAIWQVRPDVRWPLLRWKKEAVKTSNLRLAVTIAGIHACEERRRNGVIEYEWRVQEARDRGRAVRR